MKKSQKMGGIIKNFESFFKKVFKGESELLKKELSGCNSVLDLGCGSNSLLQYYNTLFSESFRFNSDNCLLSSQISISTILR
jgi:hypothetical protein